MIAHNLGFSLAISMDKERWLTKLLKSSLEVEEKRKGGWKM
jgi:hypothetical protein